MQRLQFDSPTKWYTAKLYQDLFGDWILTMSWGNKLTKLGNSKIKVLATMEDGLSELSKITKTRLNRAYTLVDDAVLGT